MSEYSNNLSEKYLKLSAVFIDKYMPSADGTFVKVYLLGLRQCSQGVKLTSKGIATVLGILETDVLHAWKYWENAGVVSCKTSSEGYLDISFNDLSDISSKSTIIPSSKPSYSSSEISGYIDNHQEMRELLLHAEKTLGKTLSTNDQSTIFSFHDWLGLPTSVISLLITYCVSINKKSMRFMETTAINWCDQGIDTLEKAEQYIAVLQENNLKISGYKRAIGISGRVVTKAENDFLMQWAYKLSSPVELVKLAAEITALNTGKISLPYMNTMLQEWYSKGIKSVTDARAMRNEFKKQSAQPILSRKGKFNDYSCKTGYDYDAIEQAALNFKNTK
ncbi:MAG: DnaD domain protein [Clostridia bacterium]|nr:DnaD domain protein [Clostridia bacterium]